MKKITTASLIFTTLAGVTLTSAKGEPLPEPKTGLYVGAALGGAALMGKSNVLLTRPLGGAPIAQNFFLTPSDKNVAGSIFAGYGRRLNCLWLAGEVLGSFSPLGANMDLGITSDNPQSLEIKTTSAIEGAFKLGYYINETHKLYLKMGVELRRFKVNFRDPSNIFVNLNKTYNSTAFVPGLGMEVELTPHFSMRTEYRIALHPKKTVNITASAAQMTTVQTTPTIHYLNLGLVLRHR